MVTQGMDLYSFSRDLPCEKLYPAIIIMSAKAKIYTPLLFAVYINELETYLWNNGINIVELSEDGISCYIKHSVIM